MPLTFEDLEKTLTFKQAWEIARKAEEPDFPWVHQRVLTEILKTQCYLLAIGEMIMSQQQTDVDAITAQLTTFQSTLSSAVTSLTTADTNIAAEIATLAAANPTLDLSALQAESSSLSSGLSSLSGIATALNALAPGITPPTGTQAFDPVSNLALYSYVGISTPDNPWYEVTDVTGPAGQALYSFASDTPGAAPTGAQAGVWVPFTGTLTPVTSPVTTGVPVVTGISPASGPAAGGGTVAVTGSGFTGATAVNFATVSATFTAVSDTTLNVIAPVGTDGTIVDVAVVTANGTSAPSTADQYTYIG